MSVSYHLIWILIMRQIKKLTWLQAFILGDVGVIWCNSLRDSLFQFHVMDFVEIVIDLYVYITSHVSQAYASCTHYTCYSLLSCVHVTVCSLVWPTKFENFWKLMQNMFACLSFFFLGIERKFWFEKSGLNSCVFGKHLISYSCIFLIKINALRGGCTKIGCFSKN